MAPPKKPDADKAKKINFTLSPAMFEAFKQKCLQEGKEISKTLQALIETFLNNDQIPSPVSAHIEGNDTSLIQSLQARIEKLEQEISRNNNPVINTHSINIESTHDETSITNTQKPANDGSPVTPMDVSPDPITVNSVATNDESPISMKDLVGHVLGRDVSATDKDYDKIYKRIKTQLKQIEFKIVKKGNKSFYSPRNEILKLIDENIEELKAE